MNNRFTARGWRLALSLVISGIVGGPATGSAQSALVFIDSPGADERVFLGQSVFISGWAADPRGPGTGVDAIEAYFGPAERGGRLIGMASYGMARPDVAAAFGRPDWASTGFQLDWVVADVPLGANELYLYAHVVESDEWVLNTQRIEVLPAEPPAPPSERPAGAPRPGQMVSIIDFSFEPAGLTMGVGSQGRWINSGPSAHTVTSDASLWDSGRLEPNQTYSLTFSSSGVYSYHCAIHPWMRGGVVVGDGRAGLEPYGPAVPYSAAPILPPPLIVGTATVAAIAAADGTATLNWTPRADATMYRVYRSLTGDPSSFVLVQTVPQSVGRLSTSLTVAGMSPGGVSYFQVRAVDAEGRETLAPTTTGSLGGFVLTVGAVASFGGGVRLTWVPVPRATGYRVYQSSTGGTNTFVLVRTVPQSLGVLAVSATISSLARGGTYYFQVRAIDPNGDEALIPATTLGGLDVMQAPTGLTVAGTTPLTVALTWSASPSATTYRVYQSPTGTAGSHVPAVLSSPTSSGATVTGLSPGATYHFYVTGVSGDGQESGPSNTVSAGTGVIPTPVLGPVPTPIP